MQMKILVVDDRKSSQTTGRTFKKDNWIVNTAADGRKPLTR